MIFKSDRKSHIVWDKDSGKPLAKFADGLFRSTDAAVIQKMQAAGYDGEPEPDDEEEADAELEQLREKAKELNIDNAERKGAKRLRDEIAKVEAAANKPAEPTDADKGSGANDGDQ